jgi:hypothetical protein
MSRDPFDEFDRLARLSPAELLAALRARQEPPRSPPSGREPRTFTRPGIRVPLAFDARNAPRPRPKRKRPPTARSGKARVARSLSEIRALLDQAKDDNNAG